MRRTGCLTIGVWITRVLSNSSSSHLVTRNNCSCLELTKLNFDNKCFIVACKVDGDAGDDGGMMVMVLVSHSSHSYATIESYRRPIKHAVLYDLAHQQPVLLWVSKPTACLQR